MRSARTVFTGVALWAQGRLRTAELSVAVPDVAIGMLFVVAYSRLRSAREHAAEIPDRPGSSRAVAGRRLEEQT